MNELYQAKEPRYVTFHDEFNHDITIDIVNNPLVQIIQTRLDDGSYIIPLKGTKTFVKEKSAKIREMVEEALA